MRVKAVVCPYCNQPAKLVYGGAIHPNRFDLNEKRFWHCKPCDAYVGCHGTSEVPLGRLANAELRKAKIAAHAAFDPLWRAKQRRDGVSKKKARSAGYRWLAEQLQISRQDCHIGMFDVALCMRTVDVCQQRRAPA